MPKKENMLIMQQRFTKEIMTEALPLPTLLLEAYTQLGLKDAELIALLKLMSVMRNRAITAEDIPGICACSESEGSELTDSLIQAQLLCVNAESKLDLEPLYSTLFDFWLFKHIAADDKPAVETASKPRSKANKLLRAFEKEFARQLSPIEVEKIMQWAAIDKMSDDMILEALNRAVMQGKRTFAYIDKILLNWKTSGYMTISEVKAHDKQTTKSESRPKSPSGRPKGFDDKRYDSSYEKLMKLGKK